MLSLDLPTGPLSVLCLGAHPDDIEIGCGGTVARSRSDPVRRVAALVMSPARRPSGSPAAPWRHLRGSGGDISRPPRRSVAQQVGRSEGSSRGACPWRRRPDLVLAPRVDDAHQDHRLIGRLAPTVWRDSLVLHYEIPKWDGDLGSRTTTWRLSDGQARRKVELLNDTSPASWPATGGTTSCSSGSCGCGGWSAGTGTRRRFYASKVLHRPDRRDDPGHDSEENAMKVLVTGDRGYIGAVLVPLFREAGHEVVGLDIGWYDGCDFGPYTLDYESRPVTSATSEPRTSPASTRSSTWPRSPTTRSATSTRRRRTR